MLNNKVVVVTGALGLIATSIVKMILREGGRVVLADCHDNTSPEVSQASEMHSDPSKAIYVQCDITKTESVKAIIDVSLESFGKIDALVNCAYPRNQNFGKDFFDVSYEDYCENLSSHLGGYFLTSQKLAEFFVKQNEGNIINFSSIYGVSAPDFSLYEGLEMTMPVEYAAIKSGLLHFTKYMASYLKGHNIRVNAISPGGIKNSQNPDFVNRYNQKCLDKGLLDPEDLLGACRFLLSDESRYVNGQNLIVDDGFTL
ncbi:MAG: SDR family oxidoreductase [Planctomycetes bacterium]|nr:SDR family oxidoreductase [Planctomycetota bacterium]